MYLSRQNPFELLVVPDTSGTAEGYLFWDDGDGVDTVEDDKYCYVTFTFSNVSIGRLVNYLVRETTFY